MRAGHKTLKKRYFSTNPKGRAFLYFNLAPRKTALTVLAKGYRDHALDRFSQVFIPPGLIRRGVPIVQNRKKSGFDRRARATRDPAMDRGVWRWRRNGPLTKTYKLSKMTALCGRYSSSGVREWHHLFFVENTLP